MRAFVAVLIIGAAICAAVDLSRWVAAARLDGPSAAPAQVEAEITPAKEHAVRANTTRSRTASDACDALETELYLLDQEMVDGNRMERVERQLSKAMHAWLVAARRGCVEAKR